MKRVFSLCVLFCWSLQFTAHSQTLPVEAFASIPDVSKMTLSPDGKHLASVVRVDGGSADGVLVSIVNLDSRKQTHPIQTDNQKFFIRSLLWANSDTLLIEADYPNMKRGVPTTETRLYKYTISDDKLSSVLNKIAMSQFKWNPQNQADVIDLLTEDAHNIYLSINGISRKSNFDSVVNVNLDSGRINIVQKAETDVIQWVTDRQHRIRLSVSLDETLYRIYEQAERKSKRRLLWEFEAFSKQQIWPIGFDQDKNILYVRAYHNDLLAIFKVNLTDPALTKTLVYKNDKYDVEGHLIYSHLKNKVVGITEGDGTEYTFWDDEYVGIMNGLNEILPDSNNYITDLSDDEQRYILFSTNSTDPGTYYLGDRSKQTLLPIAYRYKKLSPDLMAQTKTISYQARDGVNIEGFVTTPNGVEAKNLPTIIFPHGGPIGADSNSFDYWAQFFANKGYAVLRMNFRGSSGYGFEFMQAGLQGWGLEMQSDVEDGTQWMISQGITDPKRICIAGGSYGGYAALMGVAVTQGLYQCAISVAGVTDIRRLVRNAKKYMHHEIVEKQIGDDYDLLYQRSPISKAAQINVPVLLIHGSKDGVVSVRHSEEMFDELKGLDKPVEYIELDNGDHYLTDNDDRLKTFQAMDRFLSKHLPVQ